MLIVPVCIFSVPLLIICFACQAAGCRWRFTITCECCVNQLLYNIRFFSQFVVAHLPVNACFEHCFFTCIAFFMFSYWFQCSYMLYRQFHKQFANYYVFTINYKLNNFRFNLFSKKCYQLGF